MNKLNFNTHKSKTINPKNLLQFCSSALLRYCPSAFLQLCSSALLPFCLTGCMGVYEGGFECPPGIGVGCKSISEVNQMVDQGELAPPEINKQEFQTKMINSECSCGTPHPDVSSLPSEAPTIWYPALNWEEA